MALTLHFGNVVYLHLTVSFIQMLKAFTPVVTMGERWEKERGEENELKGKRKKRKEEKKAR